MSATRSQHESAFCEWKRQALERLPLDKVYGNLLTGESHDGWLLARAPGAQPDEKEARAKIADSTTEAERGVLKIGDSVCLSVFQFLTEQSKAADFRDARRIIAELSGVPLPVLTPRAQANTNNPAEQRQQAGQANGRAEPRRSGDRNDGSLRPGDDYDRRGPDWAEILEGWECVRQDGDVRLWRRPGKDEGWSGTTGYCRGQGGVDLFYPFTSNATPFGQNQLCGKFRAYALLHHSGDYSAAAKALAAEGFGDREYKSAAPKQKQDEGERAGRAIDDIQELAEHLTDDGNAKQLVRQHCEVIRYCYPWGKWLVWDGRRWKVDDTGMIHRLAKQTICELFRGASILIADLNKRLRVAGEERSDGT